MFTFHVALYTVMAKYEEDYVTDFFIIAKSMNSHRKSIRLDKLTWVQ